MCSIPIAETPREDRYWFYLRIIDKAVQAMAVGALTLLLNKSLNLVEIAIRKVLEGPGYQVEKITPYCSILVELRCNTKESFLSFIEDFETRKVEQCLQEEFKKLDMKGNWK